MPASQQVVQAGLCELEGSVILYESKAQLMLSAHVEQLMLSAHVEQK